MNRPPATTDRPENHTRRGERPPPVTPRAAAEEVIRILRAAGHEALLAGGCVRDLLLGREPKDYDVATDAVPDAIRRIFRRVIEVGAAFGVMRVHVGGREVEVATFRTDLGYADGRRPTGVAFTDARTDALRRDFTINGMFLDPATDTVIDHVDGRADLAAGVVRAIRNPEDRFAEDRLRMLRAVRFATVLGFAVEPVTLAAVAKHAAEITVVSGERIRDELSRTLPHARRATAVRLLWETGLAAALWPAVAADYGWAPGGALPAGLAAAVGALPAEAEWTTVLAVLVKGGPSVFGDAAAAGAGQLRARVDKLVDRAGEVCTELACTKAERLRVETLVRRQWDIHFADGADLAGRKRLAASPEFGELAKVHAAVAAEFGLPEQGAAAVLPLAELPDAELRPRPWLNGADLLAEGVAAGPGMGRMLERLYDAQLRGELPDRAAAVEMVLRLRDGGS